MIVGVDSYLTSGSIRHYIAGQRILSPQNPERIRPGEAAAAVLLSSGGSRTLRLTGLGLAREPAAIYNKDDLPLRGDGMTLAYKTALDQTGIEMNRLGYRISDLIGEQYWFKQTALASIRLIRGRRRLSGSLVADRVSRNVGAAVVPIMMGMAWTAARKGYHKGNPVLIDASNDRALVARLSPQWQADVTNVFANGLEISGKSVNANLWGVFPDVCFTPPENRQRRPAFRCHIPVLASPRTPTRAPGQSRLPARRST